MKHNPCVLCGEEMGEQMGNHFFRSHQGITPAREYETTFGSWTLECGVCGERIKGWHALYQHWQDEAMLHVMLVKEIEEKKKHEAQNLPNM